MNIASRTRRLFATSLVFVGLAAGLSQAQTPSVTIVNGVTCTSAQAVSVTYATGTLNINTAGCGGTATAPPTISSVTPSSGQAGSTVTINGANLAGATVTIGGLAATVASNTGTVITTSVPSTATAASLGGIVVTVAGQTPSPFPFTVLDPPPPAAPAITNVAPMSGAAGTAVIITGTALAGATVRIGGLPATIITNTGTVITTSVPATATAASTGGIVVTVGTFPTATAAFTVLAPPAPVILSVTPAAGAAGTPVTISGTGFGGASVTIGGATATIISSSLTSIATTVPPGAAAGPGNVVVTNSSASTNFAFTVNATTVGCTDISEDGVALGCVTKRPTSVEPFAPRHAGLNGAGAEINAYSMPTTRCLTSPALSKSWQHNIDLVEYKRNAIDVFLLNAGESLSYKFTVPATETTGGFSYGEAAASGGSYPAVFMTITAAPCDFDTSKVLPASTQNFCYQSGIAGLAMSYTTLTSGVPPSWCRLNKGGTYYMNIRFQDVRPVSEGGAPTRDSCTSSPCGGVLQIL